MSWFILILLWATFLLSAICFGKCLLKDSSNRQGYYNRLAILNAVLCIIIALCIVYFHNHHLTELYGK